MSQQEIENAHKLQENLLKMHKGKVLQDVFQGEVCQTSQGSCYKIEESENLKLNVVQKENATSSILKDFKLIRGIGHSTERYLKKEGYETIEDLVEHPKFSNKASEFLNIFYESPLDCMVRYYSGSHPHLLFASSFTDLEDLIFFDIETLGLKDLPVILIGMARVKGNQINVKQYLATDLREEKSMLEGFMSNLNGKTIFVSFNGRSFDLPFIRSRNHFHGINQDLNFHHLDLLHFSRRAWGRTLPNCRLQTLEKHLFQMHRCDDVPSSQVPIFYKKYLQTGNIGPLIPIVEHNKQDVITLAKILSRLQEEIPNKQ
jgi:uncharacterized protein